MTPTTNNGTIEIRTRVKSVLNLDTKETEAVVKVGTFTPVTSMKEFTDRLANDSALILKVVNEGLVEYAKTQLESDPNSPYMAFDDEGKTVAAPDNLLVFASEEKEKNFAATVLNMAKMLFGYPDITRGQKFSADEAKVQKAKKDSAKAEAITFILSNPAAIEKLKSA